MINEEVFRKYMYLTVQLPDEIREALEIMTNYVSTGVVLEIGTYRGGTANMMASIFNKVITVDSTVDWKEEIELLPNVTMVIGNSHDMGTYEDVIEQLDGKLLDILFIDGDHAIPSVMMDYFMYRNFVRPGGLIVFHDVNIHSPVHHCYVSTFWNMLKKYNSTTDIISSSGADGYGIGIIYT